MRACDRARAGACMRVKCVRACEGVSTCVRMRESTCCLWCMRTSNPSTGSEVDVPVFLHCLNLQTDWTIRRKSDDPRLGLCLALDFFL